MKKLSLLVLSALLLTLLSCSPPPFNLGISQAAGIIKNLTALGQVGPMNPGSLNLGSQGNEDVVFIPEKDGVGGITIQSGFVYSMDSVSGQQVSFVSSAGGTWAAYGSSLSLGPLSSDRYPNAVLQSVKSLHNGIAFQFDDINPGNNQYSIATGNTGLNTFVVSTGPTALNSANLVGAGTAFGPFAKYIIGLSIYPDPNPIFDRTYWLIRSQGTNNFREGLFDIDQNPITPFSGVILRPGPYDLSPFIGAASRVLYYYDPNSNRSYVSMWDSPMSPGNWSTWVWIDNVPTYSQLSSISTRIDDLLTTGELFSTQGNTGNLYDPTTPTGTLEANFQLGDLRFIGEVYIGGTPMVLFSMAVWYKNQITFNVYSIPTSKLKTLDQ